MPGDGLSYEVHMHGEYLSTRERGRAARDSLDQHVSSLSPDADAVIDLTRVAAMTFAFADEFLGRFFANLATGHGSQRAAVLCGLNDETREAMTVCLERRDLFAAVADDSSGLSLLAAPAFLNETYHHAAALKTFRAADLAEQLGTTMSNTNNRLKRLSNCGALRRDRSTNTKRGGKEFLYSTPKPPSMGRLAGRP